MFRKHLIFFALMFYITNTWSESASSALTYKKVVVKSFSTRQPHSLMIRELPVMLDLNTARAYQLQALGLGKKATEIIIKARQVAPNGKFSTLAEIMKIKGISHKKIQALFKQQALTLVS